MIKQIFIRNFVFSNSKKNHAISFNPALKSTLRYLFALCLVLGTQAVQAQTWLTLYTQDFGTGTVGSTNPTPLTTLFPGLTDYGAITAWGTTPDDGNYAISTASQNGGPAWNVWINANDHTTGTGTGNMMIINADPGKQGVQYGTIIDLPVSKKAVPGATYSFNIYAANLARKGTSLKNGYLGIGIFTGIGGTGINLSSNTYVLPQSTDGSNTILPWAGYPSTFTLPVNTTVSTIYVDIYNSDTDGSTNGNDFVIDDISLAQHVVSLTGTVKTDPNWNGTGMSAYAPGTGTGILPLYVVLVDNNNTVVSVASVNSSNGTYSISDVPWVTLADIGMRLILTSDNPAVGTTGFTPASASFPKYLFPTGSDKSNVSTISQNATLKNVIDINSSSADIASADFGVFIADFGDAPDTYGTTISNNGAESAINTNYLRIGATVDGEIDGIPGTSANGDGADEDGVSTIPAIVQSATGYSISVSVYNNTGSTQTLQGWIDFNRNGTFDTGEYATVAVPTSASQQSVTLAWSGLTGGVAGTSYFRLRLNDALPKAATDFNGIKGSGEVEDYTLCIIPAAPIAVDQVFTGSKTVADLVATAPSGATVKWYATVSGGTALNSGTALSRGTYYAESEAIVGGCTSITRTTIQVDIAPTITVPGSQTTNEDTGLIFNSSQSNLISVADVDGDNQTVTISVANGTLSLSGVIGLSFTTGDGTADATMTFSGALAAINTAINGLTYNPTSNYNGGPSILNIATNDGYGGTDNKTVSITVTAVNDVPVAVADSKTTTANTVVSLNVTTNDTDADGNNTINVTTVDLDPSTSGRQTIFTVIGEGVYTVDNSGLVTFTPVANFSGNATPINYTVNDNSGATSNSTTISITVTPVVDISINKTINNESPMVGSTVIFTLVATNNGPSNATGVTVTDILPVGYTYVSTSPTTGVSYAPATKTLTWSIGNLASSASTTLSVSATVNP